MYSETLSHYTGKEGRRGTREINPEGGHQLPPEREGRDTPTKDSSLPAIFEEIGLGLQLAI